ncbi:MAG TPA: hypothetical protein VMU88_01010 [bacterium]|nr:hypothetical protein [bacterium]
MKKLMMVLAVIFSLGGAQAALAAPCAPGAFIYRAAPARVVVVRVARPHWRWVAWHRDRRFGRCF